MAYRELRFKDIKDFMWDDAGLGGQERYLKPGWHDAHKADKVSSSMTRSTGLAKMTNWLEKNYQFITRPHLLHEKTWQDLIDQVNSKDNGRLEPLTNEPAVRPAPPLEWINNHANPLVCLDELYNAGRRIMMKKNHDYTGGSGDPYANFRGSTALDISPISGILLRVQDKLMRIKTFDEKGELLVENEGIEDALCDVINYMALIYGLVKESSRESE